MLYRCGRHRRGSIFVRRQGRCVFFTGGQTALSGGPSGPLGGWWSGRTVPRGLFRTRRRHDRTLVTQKRRQTGAFWFVLDPWALRGCRKRCVCPSGKNVGRPGGPEGPGGSTSACASVETGTHTFGTASHSSTNARPRPVLSGRSDAVGGQRRRSAPASGGPSSCSGASKMLVTSTFRLSCMECCLKGSRGRLDGQPGARQSRPSARRAPVSAVSPARASR